MDQSLALKYPNMAVDHYQARTDNVIAESGQESAPVSKHDPLFLTGRGAGNPFSSAEHKTAIEDVVAAGLGTLTSQGQTAQQVRGAGKWYKGLWRVAFTRALSAEDEGDVPLSAGASVNIGFAVWNGAQMDRNGQKSVTIWHNLKLEQ
jgi:DMSO reductase family type II enzyme heme b subunit